MISADPNVMSDNGRLLLDVISRENLVLVNLSQLCSGALTRHRVTQKNIEQSILDYLVVCDRLANYLEMMVIDEHRNFPLTKYASKKGVKKTVKSDHNTLYGRFSIEYRNLSWKKPREAIFNLKNTECQQKFTEVTQNSMKLKKCFSPLTDFGKQCNQFFNTFDDILHQCFKKVRVGWNKNRKCEIQSLLDQKSEMQKCLITSNCKLASTITQSKIENIEENLSTLCANRNVKIVNEYIGSLEDLEGRFNPTGMWRLKERLLPQEHDPPMAKKR